MATQFRVALGGKEKKKEEEKRTNTFHITMKDSIQSERE